MKAASSKYSATQTKKFVFQRLNWSSILLIIVWERKFETTPYQREPYMHLSHGTMGGIHCCSDLMLWQCSEQLLVIQPTQWSDSLLSRKCEVNLYLKRFEKIQAIKRSLVRNMRMGKAKQQSQFEMKIAHVQIINQLCESGLR